MVSIITAIVSLLILSLFAALEISFLACNRLKIELDLKQERHYAHIIEILLENSTQFLNSLKIAYAFFLVLFGVSVVNIFSPLINEYITDSLFGIIVIEIFLIVFLAVGPANLLPKRLSVNNPNLVLEKFYWLGYAVYNTISPFMKKREISQSVVPPGEPETSADIEIIQNALNFSEVLLKECMIPRTEICAISKDAA